MRLDGFEETWAEELRRRWAMEDRSWDVCATYELELADVPTWETLKAFYGEA